MNRFALLADAVLILHLAFILFAVAGGLLAVWRTKLAFVHLPALGWALWIAASNRICPLTPLENNLRSQAGEAGYSGSFIEHYLLPIIYPPGLTPTVQWVLGLGLLLLNLLIYAWVIKRARQRRAAKHTHC